MSTERKEQEIEGGSGQECIRIICIDSHSSTGETILLQNFKFVSFLPFMNNDIEIVQDMLRSSFVLLLKLLSQLQLALRPKHISSQKFALYN
jgi:hypothetical protein